MKKIIATALAGALCASLLPFTACAGGDGDKIPQIPAGVKLSSVKEEDMEETFNNVWRKFSMTSKNSVYNVYMLSDEDLNGAESNGKYNSETSQRFKYLDDGGKIFSDLKVDSNLYRSNNYKYENESYYDYNDFSAKYKVFVKDGKKGLIGEAEEKSSFRGEEKEEKYSQALTRFEEGFGLTNDIPYLYQVTYSDYGGLSLGYFGEYVTDYLNYKRNDYYVPIGSSDEDVFDTEIKVKEYKLELRADETKLYMNLSRKLTYSSGNGSSRDWNTRVTFYLDVEAGNTKDDFNENYVTEENTQDSVYYSFDTEQAAKDIKEGKQVVINPLGGADTSGLNSFSANNPAYSNSVRILFYKNGVADYDMISALNRLPVEIKSGVITIPADTYAKIKEAIGDDKISEYEIELSFDGSYRNCQYAASIYIK